MSFIRKVIGALSSLILKMGLILFAVLLAVVVFFGTPTKLKNTVDQSGIYDIAVNSAFDSFIAQSKQNEGIDEAFPLDDPEIKKIISDIFSPDFIRSSVNTTVDNIYGWLNGKTAVPNLGIDLNKSKQTLIEKIADYAVKRVEKLPDCSAKETRTLDVQNIDPFSLSCRPPTDLSLSKQQLINEMNKNEELSDNLFVSFDKDPNNKQLFENDLKPVQTVFRLSKQLPLLLMTTNLVLMAIIVLISDTRRKGIKRVSISLIGAGGLLLLSALLSAYLFSRISQPNGIMSNNIDIIDPKLRGALIKIISTIFNGINKGMIIVSVGYVVIGAAILIWLKVSAKPVAKEPPSANEANSTLKDGAKPQPPSDIEYEQASKSNDSANDKKP